MSVDYSNLPPAEKEILDISEAWSQAIVANDADAIGSFMAEDWMMVSERGVSSKEHFLSFVRSGQLTHDSMDLAELVSVSIYGDTAVLAARVTNTAHFGGETFEANEWTSDVFIKTADGWKCVITHITPVLDLTK
ncbi:MAG: nuclear transport factor 2 family protein [Pyrinomonadaceae bacterium]